MVRCLFLCLAVALSFVAEAVPVIDPIGNVSIPAGKSLIVPITATSPSGRALTYTVTSSTNRITVEVHTNNPFWKLSAVQVASSNAPGAFLTPFRGGMVPVTNIGDMTFMLFRDIAPHTVNVFQGLTASGFYNSNTIFHRVIPGFVIQGGDPQTNGSGGPAFRYDDEFNPRALFSGHGQLALANSGKDTDGSQFFITMGAQRSLDLGYTIFGQLLRGFNVLTNVISTPTGTNNRPVTDVIITQASFVPDITDTVLTLTGANLAGVTGAIRVIADDGAGGLATNSFTATTVADSFNAPPILNQPALTNLFIPVNGRATNFIGATDLDSGTIYYSAQFLDQASYNNASNSAFVSATGRLTVIPNTNYSGPLRFGVAVAPNALFSTYDSQPYVFAVGDTRLGAWSAGFVTPPTKACVNQLLATFTNGIAASPASNFTASINWGDNSVDAGVIGTNVSGQKEVRGTHIYTNSGNYPVYITIQSALGASATVVATAIVQPSIALNRSGATNTVRWPAWASDYQLQMRANLSAGNWAAVTNLSSLHGYENVVTNSLGNDETFFRLKD